MTDDDRETLEDNRAALHRRIDYILDEAELIREQLIEEQS